MNVAVAAVEVDAANVSSSVQGYARAADCDLLTPAAVSAMRRLAEAWQLSGTEAAVLIGASATSWTRLCGGTETRPLSQDQMTRVSALAGVFKALHVLFGDDIAARWPRLPNNAPVFAERSPLDLMIEDGIPGIIEVRRYLDGLASGV